MGMRQQEAFAPAEVRSSALWGNGSRGGGQRSSALWGKSARPFLVLAVAIVALAAPLAAAASTTTPKVDKNATWISQWLLAEAKAHRNQKFHVIIQSRQGAAAAQDAVKGLGNVKKQLGLIGAVAAELPAGALSSLAKMPGLTVTVDAWTKVSGSSSPYSTTQLWPAETGNAALWGADASTYAGSMPAIAIVDSGIDANRSDFAGRVVANVNLSTLDNNSPGDGRGHGTFVAGIAAGAAPGNAGAAPSAKIVSLDVMDDNGMGRTSDIITACQWILDHRAQYNIKVANFSLHSGVPSNFTTDPLDRAVEKLWFSGVTVVAAAGNYGANGQPVRVAYAPGNDPFVITVGAIDLGGNPGMGNDEAAPFSAYGYTYDGFHKPDLVAPGRYMVGPVPPTSTLVSQKPANVTRPGYIQLSGTSFAAPIVSGTAAQILARHPSWGPDQVKGVVMITARQAPNAAPGSTGAGELAASKAAGYSKTPANPNKALEEFLVPDPAGVATPTFDAAAWRAAVQASASWDTASFSDASYADASWDVASYADASYSDASYADASYADASYADASYSDASYEDAAEGDASASPTAYDLTRDDIAAIMADPALAAGAASLVP
jgi:serine protease AprX